MARIRRTAVLVALGCATICLGQKATEQAPPSPRTFARSLLAKNGKTPKPAACPAKFDDGLETNGIVPIGNVPGVTPPKALVTPEADFSDKARKQMRKRHIFESASTILLVVDTDGKPRDVCVQKYAEFDLDQEAAKSVWQYRFEPAMKDGRPVAKRIPIEVRWRLY